MSSAEHGSTDREARAKLREAKREALNNLDELEASINESTSESSSPKASTSSASTVALDKTRSDHDDEASAPVTSTTTATLTSGDAATSSAAAVSADSSGSTDSTSGSAAAPPSSSSTVSSTRDSIGSTADAHAPPSTEPHDRRSSMAEAIAKLCERFHYGGDQQTLGSRWELWLAQFRIAVRASTETNADVIKSTFLTRIGPEAFCVYETLKKADDSDSFEDIVKLLSNRFIHKGSQMAQRVKFGFDGKRQDGESIEEFVLRLRRLAKHCGFADADENIAYQLIIGGGLEQLRKKISRGKDEKITLSEVIELAKGYERESIDAGLLAKASRDSHTPIHYVSGSDRNRGNNSTRGGGHSSGAKCGNCNRPAHKDMSECSARGKECRKCRKTGHYESVCRSSGSGAGTGGSANNDHSRQTSGDKQRHHSDRSGGKGARRTRLNEIDIDTATHVVDAEEYASFCRYKDMLDYEVLALEHQSRFNNGPRAVIDLCASSVQFLVDTGAPVNVIDEQTYASLADKPRLDRCSGSYYGVGSDKPIVVLGQFMTRITFRGRTTMSAFIVVKGPTRSLLSFSAATKLGIVHICSEISAVKPVTTSAPSEAPASTPAPASAQPTSRLTLDELKAKFPRAFSAKLGCVKGHVVTLELDPSVQPVRQRLRPIAIHLRDAVSRELDEQVRDGILERVTDTSEPTPWISNLVVVPKGAKPVAIKQRVDPLLNWTPRHPSNTLEPAAEPLRVRLTCDSKALNKALKRARYPTKTIDDIIDQVSGSRLFSKLDLAKAFHQLPLAKESRPLTTIVTHQGLYRYKRLHMGISSASEIFTETIRSLLIGCNGVLNMTDDILVHGATEEEHHNNLMHVLQVLEDNGLTINGDKCAFYQKEVIFFGLRFTADGVAPTEDRCKALREATPPANVKELRSLLGMVQFSARFIQELADITEPLWRLTKDGVEWAWSDEQQRAFEALKRAISERCLAFFRRDWTTEVVVDASPVGLGAILAQINPIDASDRRVVCFASRLLTATERRYSQCEKEALAAVYGCERFWLYLFGSQFRLVTDNRAVQLIFGHSVARPPARIERWALRLTQFDYQVVHRPGKMNEADFLSRQPDRSVDLKALVDQQESERYINSIIHSALPAAITFAAIVDATKNDEELQLLRELLAKSPDRWPASLDDYRRVATELSCSADGVILRGTQILVPRALRAQVVQLAHRGHQGIVQTKRLVRSRLWFPGLDAQVERAVSECHFCQAATSDKRAYEPLKPSPMPDGPWQSVAGDFFGPLDGRYYFVNICRYSRWFDVCELSSLTAENVISHLRQLFSTFGAPLVYTSDNGPPFDSHALKAFAVDFGFIHKKVTPYWPRANGAAEAVMKKLARIVQFAKEAGVSRQVALNDFLRAYRATPHSATGVAPADLMLGHSRACGLPRLEPDEQQRRTWHSTAKSNDEAAKTRMEVDFNMRRHTRQSSLKIDDRVLLRREEKRKNETRWDSSPFTVTAINGTMVTASRPDRVITRNSSWFKPFVVGSTEAVQQPQGSFAVGKEGASAQVDSNVEASVPLTSSTTTADALASHTSTTTQKHQQQQQQPPTKRRVGRPTKAVSFELAAERKATIEARRLACPPVRASKRQSKATAVF